MSKIGISIGRNKRTCADCTKCCEGWLPADINGEMVYPGKPCSFVEPGIGCTDYKSRPKDPCKNFECSWKSSDFVPEEFSPKVTGQVISTQYVNGIPYLALTYAGKDLSTELLSWFVSFVVGRQLNAEWYVEDKQFTLGSPDFISALERRYESYRFSIQDSNK